MIPKALVLEERLFYDDRIQALQASQSRWFRDSVHTLRAKQEICWDFEFSLMGNIMLSLGIVYVTIVLDITLYGKIFFGLVFGAIAVVAAMRLLRIAGTGQ